MFLVIGVKGSGFLVFPEDFDIHSVHSTKESADQCVNGLNSDEESFENDKEFDEKSEDTMEYEVYEVPLVK